MTALEDIQNKFLTEISTVDELAQIVLKGHLVMEEIMTEAIGRYVLHSSYVSEAKLQFHQKLIICKSISVSDQENPMWKLIEKLNSVRNHLSHSLDAAERSKRVQSLKSNYEQQFGKQELTSVEGMHEDSAVCMLALAGCIGYLHTFLEEIKRFETIINGLNQTMNSKV